ncbi:MAG: hypothetical protein ACI9D5_002947 [Candidatus Endobugula sp.]|jgi:hypothetical protein
MKLLYEAENTIEAHMILNLLEQSALSARIDGEYLQGAIGELQAMGIVKIMIKEQDYAAANIIIQEWNTRQPEQEIQKKNITPRSNFGVALIGFICGIVAMAAYYNTPVTDEGIDYNGDGTLDEIWTYVNHLISKTEMDRNLDGKIDFIYSFDRRGLIQSSLSDEDFNGSYDTEVHYDYGNAVWQKSDTNGDGFRNYKIDFEYGTAKTITFFDPRTKKVIKTQEYDGLMLRKGKIDTTGDGALDTLYEYDSIEEITKKSNQ